MSPRAQRVAEYVNAKSNHVGEPRRSCDAKSWETFSRYEGRVPGDCPTSFLSRKRTHMVSPRLRIDTIPFNVFIFGPPTHPAHPPPTPPPTRTHTLPLSKMGFRMGLLRWECCCYRSGFYQSLTPDGLILFILRRYRPF